MKVLMVFTFWFALAMGQSEPGNNLNDTFVYTAVEKQPEFPGGEGALGKYILNHFKPRINTNANIQTRFFASFVVEKDGSISNVKIIRPQHTEAEQVFVNMIKSFPKWRPGVQRNKIVRCSFTLPMNIEYSNE